MRYGFSPRPCCRELGRNRTVVRDVADRVTRQCSSSCGVAAPPRATGASAPQSPGAGDGNRTRAPALATRRSTFELHLRPRFWISAWLAVSQPFGLAEALFGFASIEGTTRGLCRGAGDWTRTSLAGLEGRMLAWSNTRITRAKARCPPREALALPRGGARPCGRARPSAHPRGAGCGSRTRLRSVPGSASHQTIASRVDPPGTAPGAAACRAAA